jgi:hypothetical protein
MLASRDVVKGLPGLPHNVGPHLQTPAVVPLQSASISGGRREQNCSWRCHQDVSPDLGGARELLCELDV